jgi:hypothetical protein
MRPFLVLGVGTILLSFAGCGSPNSAPSPNSVEPPTSPLASLRVQLTATEKTGDARPDRLALTWINFDLRYSRGEWATTQEISFSGKLPQEYVFDVKELPPDSAMQPTEEGTGRFAIGVLMAYSDLNRNRLLDTIPSGGGPIDKILGVSGAWPGPYFTSEYIEVWYVEGTPPAEPPGLKEGFNLRGRDGVVPLDTPIPIPIHPRAIDNLYVCNAIDTDEIPHMPDLNKCLGPGPLRVMASLSKINGTDQVWIELYSGAGEHPDAEITVNGRAIPYDPTNHAYSSVDFMGQLLVENSANTILVRRPGEADTSVSVHLDPDFSITSGSGTYRWDATIPLRWTASEGVARYRIRQRIRIDPPQNRWFWSTGTSFDVPPLRVDPGVSNLGSQIAVFAFRRTWDDNGTDVFAMTRRSVEITYTQ